ncbi:expressed unknown protein [Seminavis robusta]|uniref:Uncharacterized protein n=1 Tax=Seminavis robusta TaxID=568900 RepID=A0A9N8DML8_9STRA|nr:expressed unknown protein [Seminavis robusta]|eukprot:Sro216_g089520.1 n/a (315) ;mRNA; r:76988-77932
MTSMPDTGNGNLLWTLGVAGVVVGIGAALMGGRKEDKKKEEESWDSHVGKEHGSLEEIFPEKLYRLEAPGCEYGPPTRNMIIYRILPSKQTEDKPRLLIFNAIAVGEHVLQDILQLGTPTVMVIPNDMHRCCAAVWKKRFPEISVVCPPKAKPKAEEVVNVSCRLLQELAMEPEWMDWITVRHIDGWVEFEDVLEVKLSDTKKAMIVCDLLFTIPYQQDSGMGGKFIQWLFDSNVDSSNNDDNTQLTIPKVSRVARIFGIADWKKAEQWYRNYADQSVYAILVGHGPPVVELDATKGCTDALVGVADQLVKPRW